MSLGLGLIVGQNYRAEDVTSGIRDIFLTAIFKVTANCCPNQEESQPDRGLFNVTAHAVCF